MSHGGPTEEGRSSLALSTPRHGGAPGAHAQAAASSAHARAQGGGGETTSETHAQ